MIPQTSFEKLIKNLLSDDNTNRKNVLIHSLNLLQEICHLYDEKDLLSKDAQELVETINMMLTQVTEVTIDASSIKRAKEMEIPQNVIPQIIKITENPVSSFEESDEEFLDSKKTEHEKIHDVSSKNEQYNDDQEFEEESVGGTSQDDILFDTHASIEIESKNSYEYLAERWNGKVDKWFHIDIPIVEDKHKQVAEFIHRATDVRSNLASASVSIRSLKEKLRRFDRYWNMFKQQATTDGYEVYPHKFGRIPEVQGDVIYSFRPKAKSTENISIRPGLRFGKVDLVTPITLITLPKTEELPEDYKEKDLPIHWRGVLGEVDILLHYLDIQQNVSCSIEIINKGKVEPLSRCKENVINELLRRREALINAIRGDETIYRIATNYWRIEECFWSVFHDDGRPLGYSFFDRLRRRLQSWRASVRKENNLFVRDFSPNNDTLTSINKYVGNVIFQTDKKIVPGTVLREIRPAIIVKVNKATRILKGRVIST